MKKFKVEISQNGWEYIGFAIITANDIKKTDSRIIVADGVIIEFDEEIGEISEMT